MERRERERRTPRDRRTNRSRRGADAFSAVGELRRVLVIEPHEDTRLLYTLLFEESNYVVYGASDGLAGMTFVQQRLPDVVLMEVEIPGIDGLEMISELAKNAATADIPVVVVTSRLHFDVPERARASGAVLVLAKPVDPEALLAAVDEFIRATPPDRFIKRRLTRWLLTIRKFGTRFDQAADARQRIRGLIDRLQVAVLGLDQQGQYIAASRGASRLTGYSQDELLRRSIFDVNEAGENLPIQERWRDFLAAERCTASAVIRNRQGHTVKIQTAFATILPGLHVAAFAPANYVGDR